MGEYLSIKDFAVRAGCSKQAVYARLNQESIAKFVKVENGKKLINSDAIRLFKVLNNQEKRSSSSQESRTKSKVETQETIDLLLKQIDDLKAEKQELSKQLTLALQIQAADKVELTELRQQVRMLTAGTTTQPEEQTADAPSAPQETTTQPKKKTIWQRLDEWLTL